MQGKRLKPQVQISFLLGSLIFFLLMKQERGGRFGLVFVNKFANIISVAVVFRLIKIERTLTLSYNRLEKGYIRSQHTNSGHVSLRTTAKKI
jgi:hypothetical protein